MKAELYNLIAYHKPREQSFKIDQLFEKHGHTVIRLPPYQPELNPIENIWAIIKQHVAANNVDFTQASIKKIVEEKISKRNDEWKRICDHVLKTENEYVKNDGIVDEMFDNNINIFR